MKKSIVVLAMMLGLGSSMAFAQESFVRESFDSPWVEQFVPTDEFTPIEEQELPEAVVSMLNNHGALIKEAYAAFTPDSGRIFKVVILSCDQKEKTVYLDERGNFVNP